MAAPIVIANAFLFRFRSAPRGKKFRETEDVWARVYARNTKATGGASHSFRPRAAAGGAERVPPLRGIESDEVGAILNSPAYHPAHNRLVISGYAPLKGTPAVLRARACGGVASRSGFPRSIRARRGERAPDNPPRRSETRPRAN